VPTSSLVPDPAAVSRAASCRGSFDAGDCLLLAIESSCDETAAAVVDRRLVIRSNVVSSQTELHRRFGGVVPEIASRAHVRRIIPAIDEALATAGVRLDQLTAVAVTSRPGLVGSLLVGLTAAKTLAFALGIPLVDVSHVEAHLYACRMAAGEDVFPAVGLVVSGGHTLLYDCASALDLELLGSTIDDAAGEAFDKGAKLLGLGFPGGPAIQQAALSGDKQAIAFPRPMIDGPRLDFSFSGLKTALLYAITGSSHTRVVAPETLNPSRVCDLAASYQEAIVDVLVAKCRQALRRTGRKTLCVGGGVAANGRLRQRLVQLAEEKSTKLVLAPPDLCTDNAAMAALAWELLDRGAIAPLDLDVTPGLLRRR
jgi:N6-L-threonylcarbamoyladenine synthase